jgi:glucose-1-phosphate thymidylyltransferase
MYPITLTTKVNDIEICGMRLRDLEHMDFRYPWEVIDWARQLITQNSKLKTQNHNSKLKTIKTHDVPQIVIQGEMSVASGENVRIDPFVVLNAEQGEIVIDDGAHIYPFSYIEGPCYIGAHTEIKPHTQIHKNTSIGHHCKIGGEVSGSIIQPYTNKAHHGFVGDSYIGSWVNLGAGTTTSNLKNTYGSVRVDYPQKFEIRNSKFETEKVDTGMQFFGCIIADYVKTAINTSIYTGKIIGVYAQLFGCVTENVGSFVMYTHDGRKVFEIESAIRTQKRMFERRGVEQTEEDIEMLRTVFEQTEDERNGVAVSIL